MRDYGKLAPTFWTRGSGKRLRGDAIAQVVASYLSTSPSANMIGLYYLPIATIAHDTGIDAKEVRKALARIEAAGYAKYDADEEIVWIPNHAKIEIGVQMKSGDKRRPRVVAEAAQMSDHPFGAEFVARYADTFGLRMTTTSPPPPSSGGVQAGEGRGIEGASEHADGASADLGQVRSGQDRSVTGQDSMTAPPLTLVSPSGEISGSEKRRKGTRLPDGWLPSAETQAWAHEQGVREPCGVILDEFRDFWAGVPGARGVKLDWDATYRNRVRQVGGRSGGSGTGPRAQRQTAGTLHWLPKTGTGGDL